jgi:uncharacterized protein (TIGR03435 family)
MESARFDITAKLPAGTTADRIPPMLQNLLRERFHLTLHHEKKEQTIYTLTVVKSGAKLKESTAGETLELVDGVLKADKMDSLLRSPGAL